MLAEDDVSISDPLARALRREGYEVEVKSEGTAVLQRVLSGGVDLVVLDLGLPTMDGLEVCRRMRAEGRSVPVLVLTARAEEVDLVVGLDAGADDYVTKPFRLAELLARVRALLRRGAPEVPDVNGVRINAESRRAWLGDDELSLTAKEFDLLLALVARCGQGAHPRAVDARRVGHEPWGVVEDSRHARVVAASQTRRRCRVTPAHHDDPWLGVPLRAWLSSGNEELGCEGDCLSQRSSSPSFR